MADLFSLVLVGVVLLGVVSMMLRSGEAVAGSP